MGQTDWRVTFARMCGSGQAIAQRLAAELPPNTLMPQREHLTDICVKPSVRTPPNRQAYPAKASEFRGLMPDYPQLKHLMTKYKCICRAKLVDAGFKQHKEWQNTSPRIELLIS